LEEEIRDTYGDEVVKRNEKDRRKDSAKMGLQAKDIVEDLRKWFGRKGAAGKTGGWVDCNTCRKDKKTGRKKCKACGRESGEKRAKYPSCRPTPGACGEKGKGKSWGKKAAKKESLEMKKQTIMEMIKEAMDDVRDTYGSEVSDRNKQSIKDGSKDLGLTEGDYHYVDAADINEEYCPHCAEQMEEAKKKKACKPSKGKRFAKRVDGKCRSYGQAGKAKSGGDRIRPGTKKGDAYCARSAGIKKCKNPPCANTLSRKKWKCRGKKSMKS